MKKILVLMMAMTMCFVIIGCGGNSESSTEPKEPLDLTGTWVQTNSSSDDAWMEATIKKGVIEINWVAENGDSKSLYWAGTYTAPKKSTDEYAWTSKNDKEKTDTALLASGDDTKDFTYKDGVISYEASALGTTRTIKLEKK